MSMEYLENICHSNDVNGFNLNNNSTILLDSSIDLTKDYPVNMEKISTDFNKIGIDDFKQAFKIHLDKVYTFIDILYQIKFFNDEFHKGRSIKNISDYIINDNQLFVRHATFLLDLIDKFILLCRYKAMNISKLTDSEVKKEYNKLSVDFRKDERYFYTHIYKPSENYDEKFLDDISNLLER